MNDDRSTDFGFADDALDIPINRREFLKVTGGGIFILFTVRDMLFAQEGTGVARVMPNSLPTDFNAFLRIGADGRVGCYTGKIEMGQGVFTSLGQMLADELDVPLESVDILMGDTELCPWDMGTWGSLTTRAFGPALRAAGAEARQVLKEMASERLKVPVANLVTEEGFVFDRNNKRTRVSYAQLANGKKIERHVSGKAPLKKPSEFKIIGKSIPRRDGPDKVSGKAKFAGDIQVPGMLYAKILRPPAHGAKLMSVDLSDAEKVKGVRIIHEDDLVAVLHKYPDVAELALLKVRATFDTPRAEVDDKTIFDHFLKIASEGKVLAKDGDLTLGRRESKDVFQQTYLNDYVAHAPIEPHTAVVSVEGNKASVWASTQAPFRARDEVAKELGLSPVNVRVFPCFVGGGFGGKSWHIQVLEAARLSKLSGKPVQVAWTRKEEFFFDSFRPAAVVKITSGITGKGMMSMWDYHVYFAGERGAQQFYNIPHHSTTSYGSGWQGTAHAHPFNTGAWRAPANNTNTFARESQIDIMAAKAGVDPLEFRLQHLTDKKMQRVLQTAAEKFGWKSAKSPSGRGVGVACGVDAGTTVACMAEVEVDKATGNVKVKRVVSVQDMGLVVNPEGATIQMEGCVTMGLGYALREGLRFKGGEILDVNFDTYEIPRFSWVPNIETVLIDNQNADPQGGGEPAIITMGGVIANAIYDATGARVFQLPMTPERVKEALGKG